MTNKEIESLHLIERKEAVLFSKKTYIMRIINFPKREEKEDTKPKNDNKPKTKRMELKWTHNKIREFIKKARGK